MKTGTAIPRLEHRRGFLLQFFLIAILPLSALLLAVALGGASMHQQAMRSLVGDRDLWLARLAARAIAAQAGQAAGQVQAAAQAGEAGDLGVPAAWFDPRGELVASHNGWQRAFPGDTRARVDWRPAAGESLAYALLADATGDPRLLITASTPSGGLLVAAYPPGSWIEQGLGDSIPGGQALVVVAAPAGSSGEPWVLYQAGQYDLPFGAHPGVGAALAGESGINYFPAPPGSGREGEQVVAFAPISPLGWAFVIQEPWEAIADPMLRFTQSAPLVLAPVLLVTLLALGYAVRQIVRPLQVLESRAAELAQGDFQSIQAPVGGIPEIHNLQTQLVEMAQQLQAAQQSLHDYIGALTAGVEAERLALARELHDETLQALIALNQRVQLAARRGADTPDPAVFEELKDMMRQTMAGLRRTVGGLRPIYLEDLGLAAALQMLARELGNGNGLRVEFALHGEERRLPPEVEMAFYRLAQETLHNVARHSGAGQASLDLSYLADGTSLRVSDTGRGFQVPASPAGFVRGGHYGLMGMQERADLIGARLRIVSAPGQGTQVWVHWQAQGEARLTKL
ncbi:MAG: sensor histidine kinase [Chloroflexi bacterium]|nr:sensor histidine kinase [Chloroflexota bacterium]